MRDLTANRFGRYFAPLVFGDHYFIMEQGEHEPLITVIGVGGKKPAFEVFQNHPMETEDTQVTTTSETHTARDRRTGRVLYTLSGTKITLCDLLYGDLDILIDEKGVHIGDTTYVQNDFDGRHGGLEVFQDGSVKSGRALPESVVALLESTATQEMIVLELMTRI
jgi:hypothetical protein